MEKIEKYAREVKVGVDEAVLVSQLVYHIENPCFTIVNGEKRDIRYFYLREAKRILPKIENPLLKKGLGQLVDFYEHD